jgi:hypothetical protein
MASTETVRGMLQAFAINWPKERAWCYADETLAFFTQALADLPDELLSASAQALVREATFMPKIGEIVAKAWDLMCLAAGVPTALEAWGQVLSWLEKPKRKLQGGVWYTLKPLPPMIEAALAQIGGEKQLRRTDNVAADRARFCEAYTRLVTQLAERAALGPSGAAMLGEVARLPGVDQLRQAAHAPGTRPQLTEGDAIHTVHSIGAGNIDDTRDTLDAGASGAGG